MIEDGKLFFYSLGIIFSLTFWFIFFPLRHKYSFLPFLLAIFIIFFILYYKKNLKPKHSVIIICSIWLNLFGELYFYYNFKYYDKFLHFIIPLLLTSIIYDLNNTKYKKSSSVLIMLGISALHEIIEYFADSIFGFPMMGVIDKNGHEISSKLDDTMFDLIFGFLGAVSYFLIIKIKSVTLKLLERFIKVVLL